MKFCKSFIEWPLALHYLFLQYNYYNWGHLDKVDQSDYRKITITFALSGEWTLGKTTAKLYVCILCPKGATIILNLNWTTVILWQQIIIIIIIIIVHLHGAHVHFTWLELNKNNMLYTKNMLKTKTNKKYARKKKTTRESVPNRQCAHCKNPSKPNLD